jgi:hypothetical protein
MSYLKELQEHYRAVKARLNANVPPPVKALPKPTPDLSVKVEPLSPPSLPRAGLVPEDAEGRLVTEALREANPYWIGGNHAQAIRIAEQMVTAPRLPPLPGLVLNEVGAIRWMRVLRAVAAHHKISPSEITGKSRKRHVIKARFEVFYRLRVDLNFSYPKISQLMKKDHSTVLHGVNKVRQMLLDRRERSGDYGDPSAGNIHP